MATVVLDQAQHPTRRFVRHFFEMVGVMTLGMCVLGMAFRQLHVVLFGSGFAAAWDNHVALAASAMAFNMTAPMVVWMRYRGHSWGRGGEMAAAMNLPLLPLLAVHWAGALPESGVLVLQMVLMIPAMLGVMLYRKAEYSAAHAPHRFHGLRFARAR